MDEDEETGVAVNVERFRKDLDRLISLGERLQYAMYLETDPTLRTELEKQLAKQVGQDKVDEFLKKLPRFKSAYEGWYSESLVLLRQLLPDRVANFISFYEKPKGRKSIEYGNYVIQDYLQGLKVTFHGEVKVDSSGAFPQFQQQLGILMAANRRFESSLFEIRQLVQADLFDSEIDSARELLKNGFLRAAGAVAGVVLEKHLHQVCEDHKVAVTRKNPTISDLNELLKSNSVIEIPQWRHITLLADIRNLCDHNKKVEPTEDQVTDLINGADKVIKTVA